MVIFLYIWNTHIGGLFRFFRAITLKESKIAEWWKAGTNCANFRAIRKLLCLSNFSPKASQRQVKPHHPPTTQRLPPQVVGGESGDMTASQGLGWGLEGKGGPLIDFKKPKNSSQNWRGRSRYIHMVVKSAKALIVYIVWNVEDL